MSVNELIFLEDLKRIATKCAEEAETFKDFYAAVIEEVYKLGFQHGKDHSDLSFVQPERKMMEES